jgi:hypothetical protein
MGTKAVVITPTLFVGGSPAFPHTACMAAGQAKDVILAGGTAVLSEGDWTMAAETLRLLGVDEDWIENRIHFAQTGEILA